MPRMKKYIFFLGRKELISLAELIAVFGEKSIEKMGKKISEVKFSKEPDLEKILKNLGGTKKIAESLGEFSEEKIIEEIKKEYEGKKILFSVTTETLALRDEQNVKKTLQKIKQILNEADIKSRYQEKYIGGKGTHFEVIGNTKSPDGEKNGFELTKIKAIQNFRAYSERDYGKTFRDAGSGMLPPKLAQIMVNLAGIPAKGAIVYDPFCGSGGVLTEAIHMGYRVIGSDISEKAIEGTKKNMENDTEKVIKIFLKDATKIQISDIPQAPDLIVTESYLGPVFDKKPTEQEAIQTQRKLEPLYKESLRKLFHFGVPIVFALPFHKTIQKDFFVQGIHEEIRKNGFIMRELLPLKKLQSPKSEVEIMKAGYHPTRKTLLYDRPEQNVGREIFVLDPA